MVQGTVTLPCKCNSDFQDEAYGKGNRLHNISEDRKKAYCTVCVGSSRLAKQNSKSSPPTSARSFKGI